MDRLLFHSDSKYFPFVFLNFSFYSFSNCVLLILFLFFDLCPAPMNTRTSNPPLMPPFVRGGLSFLGTVIQLFILLNTRGAPDFLGAYHGLFLSLFLDFLCGFFSCWCEQNTGGHFIGFYYQNRGYARTTGIEIQKHNNNK